MPIFMLAPRAILFAAITFTLSAPGGLAGCTKSPPSGGSAAVSSAPPLKAGSRPLAFEYEQVSELLLVKNDPATGDAWNARLVRPDLKSTEWRIRTDTNAGTRTGAPSNTMDREADGFMILHLLDTLRTLEVVEVAPPTAADTAGLSPPQFALRWSWAGKPFEVRLGATDKKTGAT